MLLNPRPPPPAPPAPTSALPASLPSATEVASPTPPAPRLATLRRFLNRLLDLDARGCESHPNELIHRSNISAGLFLLLVFMWVFTLSLSLILVAVGILHSLWVPQIVRNVTRGHRKSLSKTYVIGTSVLRSVHLLCEPNRDLRRCHNLKKPFQTFSRVLKILCWASPIVNVMTFSTWLVLTKTLVLRRAGVSVDMLDCFPSRGPRRPGVPWGKLLRTQRRK